MTPAERELLFTMAEILKGQMQEVADFQVKSVGMVRGRLRDDLPRMNAAFQAFMNEVVDRSNPKQSNASEVANEQA